MNKSRNLSKRSYKSKSEKKEIETLNNFPALEGVESKKMDADYSKTKLTNNERIYNNLLEIREVIRDPLHGDVGITLLERFLIDLEDFQRMRGISQLGPTQLVYPGAVHNRFIHSIGTLHVAEELIGICNHNYNILNKSLEGHIIEIDPYQHLLIRLSALLHDIAHIPFGHTLEDEGNLFQPEWEDKTRSHVFQKGEPIYKCIKSTLEKFEVLDEDRIAEHICKDLQDILIEKKYKDPFIIDIVSGNLCADLLDYSQRDMLFCGLSERWGDRFIKYFSVLCVKKKKIKEEENDETKENKESESDAYELSKPQEGGTGRFILLAYKYEQEPERPKDMRWTQKMDILSEAIDLLRKRLTLNEPCTF